MKALRCQLRHGSLACRVRVELTSSKVGAWCSSTELPAGCFMRSSISVQFAKLSKLAISANCMLARMEGVEPPQTRLEGGCPIQLDDMRKEWSGRPDSNRHPFRLITFKVWASANFATARFWCEAPESNREAAIFENARYASSLQLRIVGAFPESRTRNIWFLKPARLPVAPGRQ